MTCAVAPAHHLQLYAKHRHILTGIEVSTEGDCTGPASIAPRGILVTCHAVEVANGLPSQTDYQLNCCFYLRVAMTTWLFWLLRCHEYLLLLNASRSIIQ